MLVLLLSVLHLQQPPADLIASRFEGGRVFATPVVASTHRPLKLWIDSAGSGFITQALVKEFNLPVSPIPWRGHTLRVAPLPQFEAGDNIPPPLGWRGQLPVFDPPKGDPIFAGLDGQLGASWLQDRIWLFDYPHKRLAWLAQEPAHPPDAEVSLAFDHDKAGGRLESRQFPSLSVTIDGQALAMSLDTAASVALSAAAAAKLADGLPQVRAASFITHAVAQRWHSRHPEWPFLSGAGREAGIDLIRVPVVRAARVRFTNVWFSTRPDDDVFEGEKVVGKLGPTAFGDRRLVINYPRERALFF